MKYVTDYIRARREVMLKDRFPSALHVYQDSLSKVPSQELIRRSLRILKKCLIKMLASNTL
jgi:hypothetical protein